MRESLFVAGFVLTRDDWDALDDDGREQILATLQRRDAISTRTHARKAQASRRLASKVSPLPLPPPR